VRGQFEGKGDIDPKVGSTEPRGGRPSREGEPLAGSSHYFAGRRDEPSGLVSLLQPSSKTPDFSTYVVRIAKKEALTYTYTHTRTQNHTLQAW